jgi:hypothetical protein
MKSIGIITRDANDTLSLLSLIEVDDAQLERRYIEQANRKAAAWREVLQGVSIEVWRVNASKCRPESWNGKLLESCSAH